MKTIHYSGGLEWHSKDTLHIRLRGFAVCCSGDRAQAIRSSLSQSCIPDFVTCKACLKLMVKAKAAQISKQTT